MTVTRPDSPASSDATPPQAGAVPCTWMGSAARTSQSTFVRGAPSPVRLGRQPPLLLSALLATLLLAGLQGCGKGSSMGASRATGNTAQSEKSHLSAKQIMQKGGLCALDKEVDPDDVEKGSDEELILKLYTQALAKDTPEAFKKFRALFPDSMNTRAVRENYWSRIRKNVNKFMNEPGEPGYTICRKIATDRGVKYYIKSNDRRQHPPPVEVGEVDGEKKILSFTPF